MTFFDSQTTSVRMNHNILSLRFEKDKKRHTKTNKIDIKSIILCGFIDSTFDSLV